VNWWSRLRQRGVLPIEPGGLASSRSRFPLSIQDALILVGCWALCVSLSGIVLFLPLRGLMEPLIIAEASERIKSKIRLAEIALESHDVGDLPSKPAVIQSRLPSEAHSMLSKSDQQLVQRLVDNYGLRRTFMVNPPDPQQPLGGYWIRLEVRNKGGEFWLKSRSHLWLSSWFLPLWRTVFTLIGLLAGTVVYLHWQLTRPLQQALQTMQQSPPTGGELITPRGMLGMQQLILRINELYEQINHAGSARRALLRTISHDLRGPLARLGIMTELTEPIDRERLRSDLALLVDLVEQIAMISEEQPLPRARSPFLLEQCCRRVASSYDAAKVRVRMPRLLVNLDRDLLQRTLNNLIDNALEYGKPPVTITAARAGNVLRITIDDCGTGLPTTTLLTMPRLLRADDRGQQRHSGLGLQIAESFCRLHGGRMLLLKAPGGGLRVELRLPDDRIAG
jgi:signal transduction histidine kinase